MFRGGGGGGAGSFGPQFLEMIRGLFGQRADDLLWLLIGLLLIAIILTIIVRMPPAPARPAPTVTSCLICGGELSGRVYVDRYFPNWVACSGCYDTLPPVKQRQYLPRLDRSRARPTPAQTPPAPPAQTARTGS